MDNLCNVKCAGFVLSRGICAGEKVVKMSTVGAGVTVMIRTLFDVHAVTVVPERAVDGDRIRMMRSRVHSIARVVVVL